MQHTWILECLEFYNINRTLRTFNKNSMELWKTTLEANYKPISQVNIKCSGAVFHRDTLCPVLFCVGHQHIYPASHQISRCYNNLSKKAGDKPGDKSH